MKNTTPENPTLTHAEELLMQILWRLEHFELKDVLAAYPEPKPHSNTISTFLKILTEKGFLTKVRQGRIFHYSVAVQQESYAQLVLRNVIEQYYHSPALLFEHLRVISEEVHSDFNWQDQLLDFVDTLQPNEKKAKKDKSREKESKKSKKQKKTKK